MNILDTGLLLVILVILITYLVFEYVKILTNKHRVFVLIFEDVIFETYIEFYIKERKISSLLDIKNLITSIYKKNNFEPMVLNTLFREMKLKVESFSNDNYSNEEKISCLRSINYFERTLISELNKSGIDKDFCVISIKEFINAIERIETLYDI